MTDADRDRREMLHVLNAKTARPDASLKITRRVFVHKSLYTGIAAGAAGAAVTGWFPMMNT